MPKPELSSQQKQLKKITDAWRRRQILVFLWLIVPSLMLFVPYKFISDKPVLAIAMLVIGIGCFIGMAISAYFASKTFIRDLTPEQVEILECAEQIPEMDSIYKSSTKMGTRYTANFMLELHRMWAQTPKEELLRASTPSHDGTLLRPTMENLEAPKEELLRASDEQRP
jgi:hypothetical protein